MPKVNVYLPDTLAEAVRGAGIPLSSVCQRALERAVRTATSVREGTRAVDDDWTTVGFPLERRTTGRFRHAVQLAWRCAKEREQLAVGTTCLLYGILAEGGNLAIEVLRSLDVDTNQLRVEVEAMAPDAEKGGGEAERRFTPNARKAIERAKTEAARMGHNYLGCEHLLLGVVGEEGGTAGRMLRSLGINLLVARRATISAIAAAIEGRESDSKEADVLEMLRLILARLDGIDERLAGQT